MEPDKILTLVLSASAFAFSLASTYFSVRRQEGDRDRSIRQDLGKVVQELIEAKAEEQDLQRSRDASKEPNDYMQRWLSLWQRMEVLLRRAQYLMAARPDLATDVELVVLAQAFYLSRMWGRAEQSWREAIRRSLSSDYKALNLRGYADFLFAMDRRAEGRQEYAKAIAAQQGRDDTSRYANGYTYQVWMLNEAAEPERVAECHANALREFSSMSHERLRQEALDHLQESYKQVLELARSMQGAPSVSMKLGQPPA